MVLKIQFYGIIFSLQLFPIGIYYIALVILGVFCIKMKIITNNLKISIPMGIKILQQ
jgi:hypothetical protein